MILEKELKLITNDEIREGTTKLVSDYEEWYATCPPSLSGKYHKHENTMVQHTVRTVWFANELAKEFNLNLLDRDILLSASILHDIGNAFITKEGNHPEGKYYPETGWTRIGKPTDHSMISAMIIERESFYKADVIARCTERHMSHWYPMNPQPQSLLELLLCTADYFASSENIILTV